MPPDKDKVVAASVMPAWLQSQTWACRRGYAASSFTGPWSAFNASVTDVPHSAELSATCLSFLLHRGGNSCTDIDECTMQTHECHQDAVCTNTCTAGSYTCACSPGHTGTGYECRDINGCDEHHRVICKLSMPCERALREWQAGTGDRKRREEWKKQFNCNLAQEGKHCFSALHIMYLFNWNKVSFKYDKNNKFDVSQSGFIRNMT